MELGRSPTRAGREGGVMGIKAAAREPRRSKYANSNNTNNNSNNGNNSNNNNSNNNRNNNNKDNGNNNSNSNTNKIGIIIAIRARQQKLLLRRRGSGYPPGLAAKIWLIGEYKVLESLREVLDHSRALVPASVRECLVASQRRTHNRTRLIIKGRVVARTDTAAKGKQHCATGCDLASLSQGCQVAQTVPAEIAAQDF